MKMNGNQRPCLPGRLRGPLPLLLLLCLLSSACAAAGEREGERARPNVLTAEQIEESVGANLYEVVEELRPRWLQIRGVSSLQQGSAQIGIFVNRVYQGGPEALRAMPKAGVSRMQYMDGPEASARLRTPGNTALAGAILVETGQ